MNTLGSIHPKETLDNFVHLTGPAGNGSRYLTARSVNAGLDLSSDVVAGIIEPGGEIEPGKIAQIIDGLQANRLIEKAVSGETARATIYGPRAADGIWMALVLESRGGVHKSLDTVIHMAGERMHRTWGMRLRLGQTGLNGTEAIEPDHRLYPPLVAVTAFNGLLRTIRRSSTIVTP